MDKRIIALGIFDGIHLGHQYILKNMLTFSKKNKCIPTIFTFNYINTKKKSIDNISDKIKRIKKMYKNIDIIICNFNSGITIVNWYDYIYNILCNEFNILGIFTGYNNYFGYNAEGNSYLLKKICYKLKIKYFCLQNIKKNNISISSSYIKNLIINGNIKDANIFLGYNYSLNGIVKSGKQIGRKIGFKTININYNENIIHLPNGVYITLTLINNIKYYSITNIGVAPTFIEYINKKITIETHLLNFNEYIYNKQVTIEFLDFIRNEIKFKNQKELKKQILNDILIVKKFYNMKEKL